MVANSTPKIRVLLVDDSEPVRMLFRVALSVEPDMEVIGEAADGREAIAAAETLRPDCIVLDWQMPVMDGLAAIPELRRVSSESSILLFSSKYGPGAESAALAAGADRFLEKQGDLTELVTAVRDLRT